MIQKYYDWGSMGSGGGGYLGGECTPREEKWFRTFLIIIALLLILAISQISPNPKSSNAGSNSGDSVKVMNK